MRRLRVRDPDTLTRVTEFVPEVVSFVEGIVKNSFGYEVDGSVYFDTRAFDKAEGHDYAKLEPWSKGNRELLEEGEGELSGSDCACRYQIFLFRCFVRWNRSSFCLRFCSMESFKAWRALVAVALGSRTPRMAYRMLSHGLSYLWEQHGHSLGWHRFSLPPS